MPPRKAKKKDAPPPRELIPRESKAHHYARGVGKPRGTSSSPSRLQSNSTVHPRNIDDIDKSADEAAVTGVSHNVDVLGVSNDGDELRNGEPPLKMASKKDALPPRKLNRNEPCK